MLNQLNVGDRVAYFEPISYQLLQQEKTPIDVLESRLAKNAVNPRPTGRGAVTKKKNSRVKPCVLIAK
ncbi:hypothetical protein [Providencia manganoxydans]|uniref:hypothetical protein n=1 Tax=Providencia manganoxydans TaxID=2923283 RepID=UPI0032D9F878